jgi:hypothetical protein
MLDRGWECPLIVSCVKLIIKYVMLDRGWECPLICDVR